MGTRARWGVREVTDVWGWPRETTPQTTTSRHHQLRQKCLARRLGFKSALSRGDSLLSAWGLSKCWSGCVFPWPSTCPLAVPRPHSPFQAFSACFLPEAPVPALRRADTEGPQTPTSQAVVLPPLFPPLTPSCLKGQDRPVLLLSLSGCQAQKESNPG